MLAENVNPCLVRVSRRRVWSSELLLLSLRCHCVAMVQPAESRKGLNLAFTGRANFCCTTSWRVLRQSKMSPVLMVILGSVVNLTISDRNCQKNAYFASKCLQQSLDFRNRSFSSPGVLACESGGVSQSPTS